MQTVQTLTKPTPKKPPKLSRNTPKYDITWVADELKDLLDTLAAHPEIKSKVQLFRIKEYSSQRFYKYRAKYTDNLRIQEYLKKIDEILESRLIEQGLEGKNFPFVIFLLKNHYGYQDKREIEQDTSVTFKVTRGAPTPIKEQSHNVPSATLPNRGQVIDITPTTPRVA